MFGPKASTVSFNDRAADGQAHSHPICFGRKEGSEQMIRFSSKPGSGVADCDDYEATLVQAGFHAQ